MVCERLLPTAGEVSTAGLAGHGQRLVLALSPAAAQRRYEQAARAAKVIGYLNEDGTATIAASGLDPAAVASACARVTDIARSVKRAAARRVRLDEVRAALFVGLMDGRFDGMVRPQIEAELVAHYATDPAPEDEPRADETAAAEASTAETEAAQAEAAQTEAEPCPDAPCTDEAGADEAGAGEAGLVEENATETARSEEAVPPSAAEAAEPDRRAYGVELRVGLATLLGLDDLPAEIAGLGFIPAGAARDLAATQHDGQWWFAHRRRPRPPRSTTASPAAAPDHAPRPTTPAASSPSTWRMTM